MASNSRKAETPKPPATLDRFMKSLLAVPAQEIAEQKAIYERDKKQRRGKRVATRAASRPADA